MRALEASGPGLVPEAENEGSEHHERTGSSLLELHSLRGTHTEQVEAVADDSLNGIVDPEAGAVQG